MADRVVAVAHWREIEQHIRDMMTTAIHAMEHAETEREMWRAQGRVIALRSLLNLPNTLTVLKGDA